MRGGREGGGRVLGCHRRAVRRVQRRRGVRAWLQRLAPVGWTACLLLALAHPSRRLPQHLDRRRLRHDDPPPSSRLLAKGGGCVSNYFRPPPFLLLSLYPLSFSRAILGGREARNCWTTLVFLALWACSRPSGPLLAATEASSPAPPASQAAADAEFHGPGTPSALARRVQPAYIAGLFAKGPDRAVSVYVFSTTDAYVASCRRHRIARRTVTSARTRA
jgi:hypothetical protein